ncbi:MAG TPA: sigma factor-like helix-turn-helix DNA-binding protein, partial [Gemmataceae bacterium]|nr:sigma factor-like helix-turn-helix DNA-binding protein [Gemmataceae bacterium]
MTWREVRQVLHEELTGLAERYRAPLVACFLEGKTQDEAAAQLGVAKTTLKERLERARSMLRARLVRRGLGPAAVLVATAWPSATASACLPATLVSSTVKAAGPFAAGQAAATAAISASVAALAEGVLKAMMMSKLKAAVAVVLVLGFMVTGAMVLDSRQAVAQNAKPPDLSDARFQPEIRPDLSNTQVQPEVKKDKEDTSGPPIHSLLGHKERVTSVAYSPDGKSVATIAFDGTARIWDATTGKEERCLVVRTHPTQIMFSPDNEFIVTVQQVVISPSVVAAWSRRTGEKVREFSPTKDPRTEAEQVRASGLNKCAAFSPDGKHLACGGCETTTNAGADILIYEFATGKLVREMRAPQRRIVSLTFSPDGKTLFSQGPLHQPKLLDGRRLVYDHVVRVWDVATGKERRSVLAGLGVEHLALSPDGRTLAHNGPAGRNAIILRETATGGERAKLTGPDNLILLSNKWVFGLAFSPDGRTLASAGADDGTMRRRANLSDDMKRELASGADDGEVRLWDLLSGKEVGRLAAHRGSVETIAFSSDGRMLVSGGEDGTAHIWDVSKITGRPWGSAERSAAELEVDWKDLGGNAAKGYAALGRLVSSPVSAVPFLGKRLEAAVATAAETKPIERLIGKLDDKKFQVREQ